MKKILLILLAVLLLTCCGAPAYWAGDQQGHQEMLAKLRGAWQEMGQPVLVCACLTCLRMIRQYAPDITCVSLYKVLAESGLELPAVKGREYALSDPCAAKFDETAREDVCALLDKMQVPYGILYEKTDEIPCCSFGGNVYGAEPDMANEMAKKRVEKDPRPYIAYCSNCRDIYASWGKDAVHIIDLLTGLETEGRPAPHISQRRANRIMAKALVTGEEAVMDKPLFRLDISPEVQAHMDANLIYEEDVCKVIDYAEKNNSKFVDEEGNSIAHLVIGLPTIWVEYRKLAEEHYQIVSCYCHRMTVIEPDRDYSDCINNKLDD